MLTKCICKNQKPKVRFELTIDPPKKVRRKTWQVVCLTCGARGPNRDNQDDAVKDWNYMVGDRKQLNDIDKKEERS